MGHIPLINQVLEWERRLEIENEKRKNYRIESFRDDPMLALPAVPPARAAHEPLLARILRRWRARQPVEERGCPQEPCRERLPG